MHKTRLDLLNYSYLFTLKTKRNMETNTENKKKSVWDLILKIIIAVASAVAGAMGVNAMNV